MAKKIVAWNVDQARHWFGEIIEDIEKFGAITIEWRKHQRPRTRRQSKRLHAMLRDLAIFLDEPDMKGIVKNLDIWPREERLKLFFKEDGSSYKKTVMQPKSEADLSIEEESLIIELLFKIGSECGPQFYWSDPAERSTA